jgi:uncharacterized membrane protein
MANQRESATMPATTLTGTDPEPRWPASLAVLATLILYVTLPDRLIPGPRWLVPALEMALLVPLTLKAPHRYKDEAAAGRAASIILVAIVNVANVGSLILLVQLLVSGGAAAGRDLIIAALQIWLTNVAIFALWFWEIDRGGPGARRHPIERHPDFLYPQMANPTIAPAGWKPSFLDYFYVSLTNATAFSPTDTMPLTPVAKALMSVQSLASLITVALVAARAVNILS